MALPLPPIYPGGDFLASMAASNAVKQSSLENEAARLKNQYYAPNIQSEINQRNTLTKGYDIANQYAPERLRLANALSGQQLEWNPRNWQSENAFRNANTNKTNQMLPYEIENQKNINEWYARKAQSSIDANKALSDYRNMGGGSAGTGAKDLNDMSRTLKQEHPDWSNDQILDARNRYFDGESTFSDGTPLPPPSGGVRTLLGSSYKRRTDVAQRSAERYADTLETAIKSADKNIKAAVKYSGLIGKGQGSSERLSSLLGGESSKDFQAFNNFVKVDVPTIAGEYMRELGVNASDEQKRMYKEVVNPVTWLNDPKTALSQWEYFKKIAKNVAGTISKDPYQRNSELRKGNKKEDTSSNKTVWTRDQNGQLVRAG